MRVDMAGKISSALTMVAAGAAMLFEGAWVSALMWLAVAVALVTLANYVQDRGRRAARPRCLDPAMRVDPAGRYADLSHRRGAPMDAQPDLSQLTDGELKDLIRQLTEEEREVSKQRRVLHGRIEILKSELIGRLKGRDEGDLSVVDVDALSKILAGRLPDLDQLQGD